VPVRGGEGAAYNHDEIGAPGKGGDTGYFSALGRKKRPICGGGGSGEGKKLAKRRTELHYEVMRGVWGGEKRQKRDKKEEDQHCPRMERTGGLRAGTHKGGRIGETAVDEKSRKRGSEKTLGTTSSLETTHERFCGALGGNDISLGRKTERGGNVQCASLGKAHWASSLGGKGGDKGG